MWFMFGLGVLVCVGILFVPGFFLLRALGCPRCLAISCAPCISVFEHVIFGLIYGLLGISVSWLYVVLPGTLIGAFFYFLLGRSFGSRIEDWKPLTDVPRKALVLFLCVALVVTLYFFVMPLDGPDSIVQEFDNAYHINLIYTFLSTGRFSTLQAVLGAATPLQPFGDISFYPAAWHVVAALSADAVGASAAMGENIANTVFLAFVFPTSICAYLSFVFKSNKRILLCSALVFMAFSAFPWGFLVAGPLYSNFAALALLPAAMAMAFSFLEMLPSRSAAVPGLLTCASLLSIAFAQPNAVFTGIILFAPHLLARIDCPNLGKRVWWTRAGIVLGVILLWVLFRNLPLFRSVVSSGWSPYADGNEFQALFDYLILQFRNSIAQPELAALVFVGAVYAVCKREWSLFLPSYGYFLVAYFILASCWPGNPFGSFFSGFWYNDADRIAACGALAAIPLAGMGVNAFICLFQKIAETAWEACDARAFISVVVCVAAVFFIYMPSHSITGHGMVYTALGDRRGRLEDLATLYGALTDEEVSFVKECRSIVGDGKVLNNPFDGSVFAFGTTGLNVYFKEYRPIIRSADHINGWRLTRWIDRIENNEGVQEAAESLGIEYVLVLDIAGSPEPSMYSFPSYRESHWQGIINITDETPGFEVVLAEGDMRLYRIVD